MGDESNSFHSRVVRPHTEEMLAIQKGDLVLDTACGTGNFSQRLAELEARVVAFDIVKNWLSMPGGGGPPIQAAFHFIPMMPRTIAGSLS
ncbi:MAG TPA: hypothetical protein VMC42_02840 [Methanoregulaceae archaeon]|nr:hypothetical protein [Methanoregulaceae archaeon]